MELYQNWPSVDGLGSLATDSMVSPIEAGSVVMFVTDEFVILLEGITPSIPSVASIVPLERTLLAKFLVIVPINFYVRVTFLTAIVGFINSSVAAVGVGTEPPKAKPAVVVPAPDN